MGFGVDPTGSDNGVSGIGGNEPDYDSHDDSNDRSDRSRDAGRFQDEFNGKKAGNGQSHGDPTDAQEDEKSFFDRVRDFLNQPAPSWESRPEYYDPDWLMGTSMAELDQQVAARRAVKEAKETRHIEGAFAGEYSNQLETPDFSRFDAVGTGPSLSPSLEIPDISAPADTNWNAVREAEVFSEKDNITDAMASPVSMESSDAHLNQSRPNDLLNIGYDASGNFGVGNFWDADNTYSLESQDPAALINQMRVWSLRRHPPNLLQALSLANFSPIPRSAIPLNLNHIQKV